MWTVRGDVTARPYKIDRVVVVFFNAGRDRKHVGVKDDVLGWKPNHFGEDLIGAGANLALPCLCVGLSVFIKGHDNHGKSVLADFLCLRDERGFAFLQRDGIDDSLTLHALHAGF